jgi:hypothetical protein
LDKFRSIPGIATVFSENIGIWRKQRRKTHSIAECAEIAEILMLFSAISGALCSKRFGKDHSWERRPNARLALML